MSTLTKALSLLLGALVMLSLFSLVATVHAAANPSPPSTAVRLVFIHHSTGEAWLRDDYGGFGIALRNNHYFVSDTNYGWGPSGIGSYTDIGNWWQWFRGPNSATYLSALYLTSERNADYSRLATPPAGSNQVILFKSCFPNSNLKGAANDPVPPISSNPLRGQDSSSEYHTVANAKGIYLDLLNYFKTRQDKLFIIATAPPVSDSTYAGNARAFNQWLTYDYLKNYPYKNVFVFDYYNVLTTNGGNPNTNDLNQATGNHHRWWNNAIQHTVVGNHNVTAYPTGDDHPSAAGDVKATGEFVPLLNIAYNQWKASITLKKPTTFTIATSTAAPTTNVPFILSGTLKSGTAALAGKPVHLERRTGTTGTWANVAGTYKYTNAYGKISISLTVATAGTYQYRWHYNGTATYQLAYSAALTETVKAQTTKATLAATTTTPAVNQKVTLTARLYRSNSATHTWGVLAGKPVTIWHTYKGVRYNDVIKTTSAGQITFVQKFGSTGVRYYYVSFAGDTSYKASTSSVLTITVH